SSFDRRHGVKQEFQATWYAAGCRFEDKKLGITDEITTSKDNDQRPDERIIRFRWKNVVAGRSKNARHFFKRMVGEI
ncbi:hypothetical protein BDFB_001153, partial [Asbolus verrucosus]